jgi:hypothetical protein
MRFVKRREDRREGVKHAGGNDRGSFYSCLNGKMARKDLEANFCRVEIRVVISGRHIKTRLVQGDTSTLNKGWRKQHGNRVNTRIRRGVHRVKIEQDRDSGFIVNEAAFVQNNMYSGSCAFL